MPIPAPERIMAQVTPRAGVGLGGVDYFLIAPDPASAAPGWVVYLRNGKGSYSADLAGAHVKAFTATPRPVTTPSVPQTTPAAPTTVPTPTNPATTPSRGQVQRQLDCIRRAGGDSAKVAACLRAK